MRVLTIVVGLIIFFSIIGKANPGEVKKDLVRTAAVNFIGQQFPYPYKYQIDRIETIPGETGPALYVVQLNPGGWILFSAIDATEPVLAFSYESTFESKTDQNSTVDYWIKGYAGQIEEIKKTKSDRNPGWDALQQKEVGFKSAALVDTVAPLIKVKWDQDEGWNRFCPFDLEGPGGKTYVGCVGVAIAQAMSVYGYPKTGTGRVNYNSDYGYIFVNFEAVKDYSWEEMALDTPDNNNARILYHAAASVRMNFGIDGSGTLTSYAPYAFNNYFKYSPGVEYVERYSDDTEWKQLLMNELQEGRPIIYSGYPSTNEDGHAFNIDGVASNGFFHLNWGWSGKYNGYYHINSLKPGINDFTKKQGAVIGIEPLSAIPTDLVLSDSVIDEGKPVGSYVSVVEVVSERSDFPYKFEVLGKEISEGNYHLPEFYIENDTLKSLAVFDYSEDSIKELTIIVSDTLGNSYAEKFKVSVSPVTSTEIKGIESDEFAIFPNPVTDYLTVYAKHGRRIIVSLYSLNGVVLSNKISDSNETLIDFRDLENGVYILRIDDLAKGQSIARKIIK